MTGGCRFAVRVGAVCSRVELGREAGVLPAATRKWGVADRLREERTAEGEGAGEIDVHVAAEPGAVDTPNGGVASHPDIASIGAGESHGGRTSSVRFGIAGGGAGLGEQCTFS